jgi:hypothetical protein
VPLFDAVKMNGQAVAAALEPGERLLAMGTVHTHWSGDTSELASEGGEPGGSGRLVEGADWAGVQYNQDSVNRLIAGASGSGTSGSWADQTWQAIKAHDVGTLDWAITDRRLLLLDHKIGNPPTFTLHFAVPREAIRATRRRSKLFFQWGRVVVTFADGSTVAMVLALLDIGAAGNFVRALETGSAG